MVIKITSPHSLQRALNYNEKKVEKGQAQCIHAGNYLLNPEQMNFYEKMERMADLIALNERTKKTNTLHISLNFDPSEKHTREQLMAMAEAYMEKIGFGMQPYLVYRHDDAGHPHMHIVTTSIQPDGKRIDTYNIGRNQSEKARKEIEQEFNLVRAQNKQPAIKQELIPVEVQKVLYGKAATKRSIQHVLELVIPNYKYGSLAELNAILKQYNVIADRGAENGHIFKNRGLIYSLLDQQGNKIGVSIKASLFYNKPTLEILEKKFEENLIRRQPDKQKLKTAIDWVLSKSPAGIKEFTEALQKEKIQSVMRQNKEGLIYGITFIDFRSKAVFNGSDLGKSYSIAGIQEKLSTSNKAEKNIPSAVNHIPKKTQRTKPVIQEAKPDPEIKVKESLWEAMTGYEKNFQRVPGELLKKKKKKRNPNL